MTFLRPIIARLAAALIASLVAWLAAQGIDVPAETQTQLIEGTVGLMLLVFGVVYALVHKLVNRKVNPADAAAPVLAKAGQRQKAYLKGVALELGDETGG